MLQLVFVIVLPVVSAFPASWIQKIGENRPIEDFDRYIPKFGELPKYEYSVDDNRINSEEILFKNHIDEGENSDKNGNGNPKTMGDDIVDFLKEDDLTTVSYTPPETNTNSSNTTFTTQLMQVDNATILNSTMSNITTTSNPELDPIFDSNFTNYNDSNRPPRQKDDANTTETGISGVEKESQEEMSGEDDEGGNMVTSLLSSLLGGLSRPDGSIDLEAITGLLGSLSVQNPDGTYDFQGLTDLLMNFFGAGEDGGGGSDVGSFLGGLLGALLKGIANPPGAKGEGIFIGKVAAGILPALSGPAPTTETKPDTTQQLDSGGFLGGFLSTILGSSSANGSNISGGGGTGGGGGSKFSLFKLIFSMITSVFSSSSSGH